MLKPRYNTLNESVSDFGRILEGMNKTQPLDRHEIDNQVRARQDEERLRQELRHVESVIAGSGHFFTEREKREWYMKRAEIAEMLGMDPEPIEESSNHIGGDAARNSQDQNSSSALERYKVLAGVTEQIAMPRDAGIFGSTRHNENYEDMASIDDGDDEPQGEPKLKLI